MSYMTYARYRMHAAKRMPFDRAFAEVANMAANAVSAVKARLAERKTVLALSKVDDRTLQDIGVHRSEIRYLARRVSECPWLDYRKI